MTNHLSRSKETGPRYNTFADRMQKAKNLEEKAEQAVACAKTRKKVRGAKAALAMAFATRRLLEEYNK